VTPRLSTPAQGFLDDICQNPSDDAPRLIYADWLDDHNDPARAEFIRVQCELARLDPNDLSRPALIEREAALLAAHEPTWRAALPDIPGVCWGHFARGFVAEMIPRTVADLERNATVIFATQPVEELQLRNPEARTEGLLPNLASLPEPERWTSLVLDNYNLRRDIAWFDSARDLHRLSSVTLSYCRALGSFLAALVSERQFPGLMTLRFRWCEGVSHSIRSLMRQPGVARLRLLDLKDAYITLATALAVIESPNLRDPRALNLNRRWLSNPALVEERLRQRFPLVPVSLRYQI
jgi:uncharacterized protein (TIGR02996 family)